MNSSFANGVALGRVLVGPICCSLKWLMQPGVRNAGPFSAMAFAVGLTIVIAPNGSIQIAAAAVCGTRSQS